jgi:hypothetical protein
MEVREMKVREIELPWKFHGSQRDENTRNRVPNFSDGISYLFYQCV